MKMKKGEIAVLAALILTIIIIFFLIYLGWKVGNAADEQSSLEKCRISAVAKAKSRFILPDSPFFKGLECETKLIKVEKDGFYADGRSLGIEVTSQNIQRVFANQMHECWYQFGEGKVQPFGKEVLSAKNHCIICSSIQFAGYPYEDIEQDEYEFTNYLQNTRLGLYSIKEESRPLTYYDFLTRTSPLELGRQVDGFSLPFVFADIPPSGPIQDVIRIDPGDPINPEDSKRKYYIVFSAYVQDYLRADTTGPQQEFYKDLMERLDMLNTPWEDILSGDFLRDKSVVQLLAVDSVDWDEFRKQDFCQELF